MKKFLLIITIVFMGIFLTGCESKEEKNDLKNAEINKEVVTKVDDKETINRLQFIDSNILSTSLGLDLGDVEDYMGKIPTYNLPEENLYIAIKPSKGNEEKVKKALDLYINSLETKLSEIQIDETTGKQETIETEALKTLKAMTKEEYKGYYIYVSSNESSKIVEILKNNIK